MSIRHENMIIESNLPTSQVLNLEMIHQLNQHATLRINLVIESDAQTSFLRTNYQGQNIQLLSHHEDAPLLIFSGKIQTLTYEKQNELITARVEATSYSIELDEEKKRCTFQDSTLTFRNLLDLITKDDHAHFMWEVEADQPLNKPFAQYDETNWCFIQRLASYFERPIYPILHSKKPSFHFGISSGKQQTIDEVNIVEIGISEHYYQSGGYEKGMLPEHYRYLKIKHRTPWQIGDFIWHRNRKLTVIEQRVIFEKGELMFANTLGAEGFFYQKTIYADQLTGLNLQGTIRQVKKESITIQLDIDTEEQAHYFWPWVPEAGNLNYLMPEVGSKVVLTLPTHDEQDGIATHLLRTNSGSPVYQNIENKQIVTQDDKTIGLYPEAILLSGKERSVTITLADREGIRLNSNKAIRLTANQQIELIGNKVTLDAPERLLMQTADSNIEIAKNFNLFAPQGVKTSSSRSHQPPTRQESTQGDDPNHWPLSYGALGAMPKVNLSQMNDDAIVGLATNGAMPQIARGQTAQVMIEMMGGKKAEETSYPRVFSSMDNYSMKGGSAVPREEIED